MPTFPSLLSAALIAFGVLIVVLLLIFFIRKGNPGRRAEPRAAEGVPGAPAAESGGNSGAAERGAFVAAVSAAIATVMGEHVGGIRIRSIKKLD